MLHFEFKHQDSRPETPQNSQVELADLEILKDFPVKVLRNSPWVLLYAILASKGKAQLALEIPEYLALREKSEKAGLTDAERERFQGLQELIRQDYGNDSDFYKYLDDPVFSQTLGDLLDYHEKIVEDAVEQTEDGTEYKLNDFACDALARTVDAKKRLRGHIQSLLASFQRNEKFWDVDRVAKVIRKKLPHLSEQEAENAAKLLEAEFVVIATESLNKTEGIWAKVITKGNQILDYVGRDEHTFSHDQAVEALMNTGLGFTQDTAHEIVANVFPELTKDLKLAYKALESGHDASEGEFTPEEESKLWIRQRVERSNDILRSITTRRDDPKAFVDLSHADVIEYATNTAVASSYPGSVAEKNRGYMQFAADTSGPIGDDLWSREAVNIAGHFVDPREESLLYRCRTAYSNVKYDLGLLPDEIDFYGTTLGVLSSVMRGYGMEEMSDIVKLKLHNTADHTLQTAILIAHQRDKKIKKLEFLKANGQISEEQFASQVRIAQDSAHHRIRKAFVHDMGEALAEVLGNNLKGKGVTAESAMRVFRDMLEGRIASHFALQEIAARLRDIGWDEDKIKPFIESTLEYLGTKKAESDGYDYHNPLDEALFDIDERQQTNRHMPFRRMGTITTAQEWMNTGNLGYDDARYTLQYVISKLLGENNAKFKSQDEFAQEEYYFKEYVRRLDRNAHAATQQTADITGAPKEYLEANKLKDNDHTALHFDIHIASTPFDYENSVFKKFVDQMIHNYMTLPLDEAQARQRDYEIDIACDIEEAVFLAREHAKSSKTHDMDKRVDELERALLSKLAEARVRVEDELSCAQDKFAARIAKLKADGKADEAAAVEARIAALNGQGIKMQYLSPAHLIANMERTPILTVNKDKVRVGAIAWGRNQIVKGLSLAKPEIKNQLITVQRVTAPLTLAAGKLVGAFKTASLGTLNTLPSLLLQREIDSITLQDMKRIHAKMALAAETPGDLTLAGTGILQDPDKFLLALQTLDPTLVDTHVWALINPVFTYLKQVKGTHLGAAAKVVPNLLRMFPDEIARKYGFEPRDAESGTPCAIDILLKSSYLSKERTYIRRDSDSTAEADEADRMFPYLQAEYLRRREGGEDESDSSEKSQKQKDFELQTEFAEAQILQAYLRNEIRKASDRADLTIDPEVKVKRLKEKEVLEAALEKVSTSLMMTIFGRHGLLTRFTTITALGLLFANSDVSGEVEISGLGSVNPSEIFGYTLAFAGATAGAAVLKENSKRVSQRNWLMRQLRKAPYITADTDKKGEQTGYSHIERMVYHVLRENGTYSKRSLKKLLSLKQRFDLASNDKDIAGLVEHVGLLGASAIPTLFNSLASFDRSGQAFMYMNAAQAALAASVVSKAATEEMTLSLAGQIALALFTMTVFRRANANVLVYNEYKKLLDEGKDPDLETIKTEAKRKVREETLHPLFDMCNNIGRVLKTNMSQKIFDAVTLVSLNNVASRAEEKVYQWRSADDAANDNSGWWRRRRRRPPDEPPPENKVA